jgi:hypothetical protein
MNKYAFLTGPARSTEIAKGSDRIAAANVKESERRAYFGVNRCRSLSQDESFSLTIRAEDGRTLWETRVEHKHQAFQRLIDWSISDEAVFDICAAISGPDGFCTNHRFKASEDFAWIESEET